MKVPKLNTNFYKVIVGIAFSLIWARVMYFIWSQPSYLTFIWFYLGIGSVILKWVLFEVIDKVALKIRVRNLKRELEEADRRVRQAEKRR